MPHACTMDHLTLIQPDDWHLHLRDGEALAAVVAASAAQFRRAIPGWTSGSKLR